MNKLFSFILVFRVVLFHSKLIVPTRSASVRERKRERLRRERSKQNALFEFHIQFQLYGSHSEYIKSMFFIKISGVETTLGWKCMFNGFSTVPTIDSRCTRTTTIHFPNANFSFILLNRMNRNHFCVDSPFLFYIINRDDDRNGVDAGDANDNSNLFIRLR